MGKRGTRRTVCLSSISIKTRIETEHLIAAGVKHPQGLSSISIKTRIETPCLKPNNDTVRLFKFYIH